MASRIKKMFHRKKDEDIEEPQLQSRPRGAAGSTPNLRTSLYDSTTTGGNPQTGNYPIKGNDNSVVLQTGRKSSVRSLRSRRSSSRSSQYNAPYREPNPNKYDGGRAATRVPPPLQSDFTGSEPYDPYQDAQYSLDGQDNAQKGWSRTPLPQEFANLNLNDGQSPTTVTQTVTTTRTPHQGFSVNQSHPQTQATPNQRNHPNPRAPIRDTPHQDPYVNPRAPQTQGHGNRNHAGARSVNQQEDGWPSVSSPQRNEPPTQSRHEDHNPLPGQEDYDMKQERRRSIPRKQVGNSVQVQSPSRSNPQNEVSRQQNASKALPSTPTSPISNYDARKMEGPTKPTSMVNRSRPVSRGAASLPKAQDIVERAKSKTYDTEVIERVAPAVMHENVSKDIHHIREEVITREVHTHDVYHRILPVIDVEVLPPRHFLPVEGGGLVEVSASEVPGRGQNWVIAETASKIASDQAVPREPRKFTARTFAGTEGDSVRYMTAEGYEKTEETWVHPPELEEGARLTGQSWPMVFGEETAAGVASGSPSSKQTKSRNGRKGASAHASPAQMAGGLGRSM